VQVKIEEVSKIDKTIEEFSTLLKEVVDEGASIGFLPPLQIKEAKNYWQTIIAPSNVLFAARASDQLIGTVQIPACDKAQWRSSG